MEIFNLAIMLIAAALAGLGIGFWWWDQRFKRQKRAYETQIRQQVEQLEKQHQNRIQDAIQSLRQEYEEQLIQKGEETERYYQQQLNQANEFWRDRLTTERRQLTEQIQVRGIELNDLNQSLNGYGTQLNQVNQQLVSSDQQVQQMNRNLKEYEAQLGEMSQQLEQSRGQVQNMDEAMNLYENYLMKLHETHENTQADLHNRMNALEQQHQTKIKQIQQNLEYIQENKIKNAIAGLEQEYRASIRQGTDKLVRSMQDNTPTTPEEQSLISPSARETSPESVIAEHPQQQAITAPETVEENQANQAKTVTPSGLAETEIADTHLIETINHLGNSSVLSAVPQLLSYAQHQDDRVREQLAIALGKIAKTNSLRTEISQAIPTLEKLSQDPNSQVRQDAVIALGAIKSEKVIPVLQRALRDSNYGVVRSATVALEKFKSYPVKSQAKLQNLSLQKSQSKQQ